MYVEQCGDEACLPNVTILAHASGVGMDGNVSGYTGTFTAVETHLRVRFKSMNSTKLISHFKAENSVYSQEYFLTACEAGTYKSAIGSQACTACDVGTNSLPGAVNCTASFDATSGFLQCQAASVCEVGTFYNRLMEICKPCLYGSGPCVLCPTGTFKPEFGTDICIACSANALTCTGVDYSCKQYHSKVIISLWSTTSRRLLQWTIDIVPGPYCLCSDAGYIETTDENNEASCTKRAGGTYETADGLHDCESCPVGTNTDTVGTLGCRACPSGSRSDAGSFDCKCLARYTPKLDSLNTDNSSNVGHGWGCVECNANTFMSNVGNMTCDECPDRMNLNSGSDAKSDCRCILPLGESDGVFVDSAKGMHRDYSGGSQCNVYVLRDGIRDHFWSCVLRVY